MRPQHVRMPRDPTVVWCLFSREPLRTPAQSLRYRKLESLSNITAAIVWVYLYFVIRNYFRKPRKDVQDERYTRDPTVFYNVFFLENPSEYPHKPYIAKKWTPCRRFAPLIDNLIFTVWMKVVWLAERTVAEVQAANVGKVNDIILSRK